MRIWSVHPSQLDRAALIAGWREALLAQAVLAGRTKGYTAHPQLQRFKATADPLATIGAFLSGTADEATRRGYTFDRTRIDRPGEPDGSLTVTQGQLDFEWAHLGAKFAARSPDDRERWLVDQPRAHPLFTVIDGDVESWERGTLP